MGRPGPRAAIPGGRVRQRAGLSFFWFRAIDLFRALGPLLVSRFRD
jgi:hypothetical protein